jgi:hypothetical protein
MTMKRQNTKAFEAELRERIQKGVYDKICLYYENQEDKPPTTQAPDFTIEQQNDLDLEKIDNTWKNTAYLFFAPEIPDCCKTPEKARKLCEKLNEKNKKHKNRNCMPDINTGHFENLAHKYGRCLYVGSCKGKMQDRVKHHLGKLSGTYGLHLKEWWGKAPIQIFFLVFGENIAGEYLSLIEDALWEAYKPLFGKEGPR